ncbi:MAG: response regulator [Clostridiaceae bacterium]|jgi:two-component system response regulator YesN|nr:response regulator [Clostridiaceae bacterium]
MYKLIIVDDEEEVRKGIIQKIDWASFGFDIPREAENGRDALDLIEENVPDAVITDITMPVMDGLKLSSIISECYPTVKIVILTGFDEFKFAQQAIRYGVIDYILKPVLPKDINNLMTRLRNIIDEEVSQKEDINRLRSHYIKSLPIIREKFLTQLVTGSLSRAETDRRIQMYDVKLKGSTFMVAAAAIDAESMERSGYGGDDSELCKFAILNISKEIIEKYPSGEAFFHDDNLVFILGSEDKDKNYLLTKTISLLDEIRFNIKKYLKIDISIGLGSMSNSVNKLKESYKNALSALEYKRLIGVNKVIYIEDLEPQSTDDIIFDEEKENQLISSIKFGSEKDVLEAIRDIFDDIIRPTLTLKDYQLYFLEIVATLSRLGRKFQVDIGQMLEVSNINAEIQKYTTLEEIKEWIEKICIELNKTISSRMQTKTQMLLEKAKDYINKNYSDDTLSLQKLADHLYISACYLSMIFKKEADETFLKYLVRVRLDAAKDLLRNTDLRTAEIAERVGYPDINYFSFFFKKNVGMSPREYRNSFKELKES